MLNELKIGAKITVLLLSVVLVSVLAISILSYTVSRNSIQERYAESLQVISNLKVKELGSIFEHLRYNTDLIRSSNKVRFGLIPLSQTVLDSLNMVANVTARNTLRDYLMPIAEVNNYENIFLLDTNGIVLYSVKAIPKEYFLGGKIKNYQYIKEKAQMDLYFEEPYEHNGQAYMNVAASVLDSDKVILGYVVTVSKMEEIYKISNDTTGLRRTGEILIGKLSTSGGSLTLLNRKRDDKNSPLFTTHISINDEIAEDLQKAVQGEDGAGSSLDYRGKKTLSEWKFLPEVRWGLVVKIDQDEINQELDFLIKTFIYSGLFVIFISWTVARLYSQYLIIPLIRLKHTLQVLSKGVLPEKIQRSSNDEIGEMALTVMELVTGLRRTADFAYSVGLGNYRADFSPLSQDDILGNALITMRNNIQEAEQKDRERNWIIGGVAEVGQILRLYNNLEEVGENILSYIARRIGAVQGAFYTTNEDQLVPILEMNACYAYSRKKFYKRNFRFAEGLVGQAAVEQQMILRTEIPNDYMTIRSGILGDHKPKCILLVPFITNEKVYGVLELAGFERFTSSQTQFVKEISVIIARTISDIKVNTRTAILLKESQQMEKELRVQQEVLRQNAEVMEATQEELKRTNAQLEEKIEEVQRSQKLMQVVLENASEVITIYEQEGMIRYISPSAERIIGFQPIELVGKSDLDNVHEDSKEDLMMMFRKLLENPNEKQAVEISYRQKSNEYIWLEATGTNRLSDKAVRGIVLNLRDITERRRAETEARMRGQMQSLSENSPDLITRLDNEGNIFYINPSINTLAALQPQELLGKNIKEISLESSIIAAWSELIDEISEKNTTIKKELPFPSVFGKRIMQVNAIPEFDNHESLESILIVSHDITEQKNTEIALLSTNKKIRESINYAQRIQSAILPDTQLIRKHLPNSFIYYKPRDVVSGDFPWFFQKENHTFIAVVDCTGHGVPGALISLIGYFLLNDIVNTQEGEMQTGKILDMLDAGVTRTLKQDVNNTTKDGMDIALCRIDTDKKEVLYSSAHRPLYLVRQGELIEYKGDRFAIGGQPLKTEKHFKTYELQYEAEDKIYMFSDGYVDQFGGIDDKRLTPKAIQKVILENHKENIEHIKILLDETFENWRGDRKQTDDVLIIGIKF